MKKGRVGARVIAIVIILAVIFCFACMERIPTGYVGTVYSMNGGVQNELLQQGYHLVAPTKHIKEFSIANEQLILSADCREGSKDNESFLVSTSDNANIKISFQMSYRYKADEVVDTYKKFKGMDGEDIVNQRVRTVLKAKVSEVTTNYSMMDIYSGNRGQINAEITSFLNEELGKQFGIEIIDASIIDVHPDSQLEKTIQDRVTAMQKKQQAQAEQQTVKVEAETKLIEARASAERVAIETEAEKQRYLELSKGITPELLQKWELDARIAHGWVTVQGGTPIVDTKG